MIELFDQILGATILRPGERVRRLDAKHVPNRTIIELDEPDHRKETMAPNSEAPNLRPTECSNCKGVVNSDAVIVRFHSCPSGTKAQGCEDHSHQSGQPPRRSSAVGPDGLSHQNRDDDDQSDRDSDGLFSASVGIVAHLHETPKG